MENIDRRLNFERRDIKKFISIFSRESVQSEENTEQNKPVILLPEDFYNATVQMCNTPRETRGVFLVSKKPHLLSKGIFSVEAMIPIGYGTSGSVFPDPEKLKAINLLLREHGPDVIPIDFHSHTTTTGSAFSETFSDLGANDDVQGLMNGINRDPNYKHVLFTPSHILTFGKDMPQFSVAEFKGDICPTDRQNYWQDKMNSFLDSSQAR